MANVLISFLGTGSLDRQIEGRQYRTAKYKIDGVEYETPFVSAAISSHIKCEKHILIGTCKSMWEEYYRYFKEGESTFSEDLYFKLAEDADQSNHKSVTFDSKNDFEAAFGGTRKVLIIKYGINEQELRENLTAILSIEDLLESGDQLYIDVTHGFRSFPLFAQQILMYLSQVSSKNVNIKKFYYGMLDAILDLGYAPVVDLSIVQNINDWILAAGLFINKVDGRQLSSLISEAGNAKLATLIKNFSDALSINYSVEIHNQYNKIIEQDFAGMAPIERLIIERAFGEYQKHFTKRTKYYRFQIDLAEWNYNKGLCGMAYLALAESIVTFVCEDRGKNVSNKEDRESAKRHLHFRQEDVGRNKYAPLRSIYAKVNKIRNNIAHVGVSRDKTFEDDIKQLTIFLNDTKTITNKIMQTKQ